MFIVDKYLESRPSDNNKNLSKRIPTITLNKSNPANSQRGKNLVIIRSSGRKTEHNDESGFDQKYIAAGKRSEKLFVMVLMLSSLKTWLESLK